MRSAVFYVVWLALLVVTLVVARARGFSDDGWDDDTLYEEDDEIIRETKWNPATPRTWICFTTAGSNVTHGGHINMTTCSNEGRGNMMWVGWVGVVIAVVFFGSNFIPVKKFDTGDGMFFQWVLCIGIWLVGLVVNMARLQPPFFLPTLLGGVLWTTGNLMAVPVIKMIGLTMGLTVWGVTNMLSGWFIGMVILKETVTCPPLNYTGVAIVVVSVIILAFVKSSGKKPDKRGRASETTPLLPEQDSLEGSLRDKVVQRGGGISSIQNSSDKLTFSPSVARNGRMGTWEWDEYDEDFSWTDRLGTWPRRIIGFSLALVAGVFFGTQFIFIEFMKLCTDHSHTCNDIDYLFGHFCGILLASTFYFAVYCILTRNNPRGYPKVILPGLISGIMWGIAMVGWFLANHQLSLAVSFPIITAGPGFVSSAWGIFIFREIRGWMNILLYFIAFLISLNGQILDGLSKETVNCST